MFLNKLILMLMMVTDGLNRNQLKKALNSM